MQEDRVLVVGAGVAGLAAAIDLAAAGCRVTVFERAEAPGGKLAAVNVAGIRVDCGPTVLTMRAVFDDLLAVAGRTLESVIEIEPARILARHVWGDGSTLDLYADLDRSARAIQEAFGRREAEAFVRFSAYAARIFATVEGPFVRAQRMDWADAVGELGRIGIGAIARIDALRTMAAALRATFRDPHLVQLFGRYATYCGSLPAEAPATLNLIAHVEQSGVHRIRGGMRRLAEALANAAQQLGVAIRCGQHVEGILVTAGATRGIRLASGETVEGDALVFNGDVSALAEALEPDARRLAPPPTKRAERSLSAVTWSAIGRIEGRPLVHHNVFFAAPDSDEFDALRGGRMPDEPTVYVCAQDRADDSCEPGDEAMLLVVNAPPTGDDANQWTDEAIRRCERATWTTLERCGVTMTMRETRRTTPVDFHRRFPGTGGALYGPRTRGALAPLGRAAARTRIQGLYLAGGSVHPGPGLPMTALSGRLAAQRVLEDLASTRRSRPAATSGTTSTR